MPILNYTTKVSPEKSAVEIQHILAKGGAQSVTIDYKNGRVSSIRFTLILGGVPIPYAIPCNIDGVHQALCRSRIHYQKQTREHAERVAWRIVKDWAEAQIALVEARQAQMAEVFLPYAIARNGQSAFQIFEANAVRLLTSGDDGNSE